MKLSLFVVFLFVLSPTFGEAEEIRSRTQRNAIERCVDVEIGGQNLSYSCLNQRLQRQVDEASSNNVAAPFDAASPGVKIGAVNIPAVKQQYGRNFGLSAFPDRPPSMYVAPLGPAR